MTLQTNLEHITSEKEFKEVIENNENVMICCGRMGPMCLPVYGAMDNLRSDYQHVAFRDLLFDSPYSHVIRNLPECQGFMGLPFTVYFKNGKVVKATSSIQSKENITTILDEEFHN
jgi:thioredoxin 1